MSKEILEEFIRINKMKPRVANRVRRLNKNNLEYGFNPRGYVLAISAWRLNILHDYLTRGQVIRKHGPSMLKIVKSRGNGKRGAYNGYDLYLSGNDGTS